ncbi:MULTISPECIES: hypothetical protein [Pseudomonas]|uniref:hypothetical protein n=1 Tax=Pseudomonas TaxID=286 RepID=UPI000D21020C|nr:MULTISPECIES: hypothetical protein [Pseudomonas]AVX87563.1 hypothetical protein PkP19E3_04245 [Pseudomonas koreensis]MBI6950826.1 hypothetical protein [Pseudomonas koreensis]MCU7217298.1 hypothetical protein [Pseudomonas sp. VE 196-7]
MTAHAKALAAPSLREAENGKLYVGKLTGAAHGEVLPYPNASVGDHITFHVVTTSGNTREDHQILTEPEVGKPIIFLIPKDVFEKNLTPEATAELRYSVTSRDQPPKASPLLTIKLER